MLISWIIIGRNWLPECNLLVESLNNQNINTELVELIIIDDCSEDESVEILQDIKYQNKKIIRLKEQSGRCYSRNYGINLASGEFCLFTNGNLIPEKNFLNKYINLLFPPLTARYSFGFVNNQRCLFRGSHDVLCKLENFHQLEVLSTYPTGVLPRTITSRRGTSASTRPNSPPRGTRPTKLMCDVSRLFDYLSIV